MKVNSEALRAFTRTALGNVGVTDSHALMVADALVTTDTWGVFTHGTKLLSGYLRRLCGGGLRTDGEPVVEKEGAAWAIVDGGSLPGQVGATFAMRKAIALARRSGIGYVGVRNSCHFGAAGYYAWQAAREGMIGQAMANDIPSMAAPGSKKAVLGTNPFAFAAPRGERDPILLDMAMSTVAGGKVFAACQRGEAIPDNWIIGPDGLPTTDGRLFPQEAALAPMSGHKGYGLGLMSETLAGVLPGAAVTWEVGSWMFDAPDGATGHGSAFFAMDVGAMMPLEAFHRRINALVDEIHEVPTAEGMGPLMVPGEREWKHRRKALEEGIELPEDVVENLEKSGSITGVEVPW